MRTYGPTPNASLAKKTHTMVMAALLFAATALLGACSTKETLDKQVDALVECFQKSDYEAFKRAASSELIQDVPEQRFRMIALIFKELGTFKERTMHAIKVENSRQEGSYNLDFDAGTVDLTLVLDHDELIGFTFSGSTWQTATQAAETKTPPASVTPPGSKSGF